MASIMKSKNGFSVRAYRGDAKTLLAFNFADMRSTKDFAGFTIKFQPAGEPAHFIHNFLRYKTPADHAQDPQEPANSSINAPIHKFRWLHVPGSVHQGLKPVFGTYTYTVTPRYFENNKMLPLDPDLSVSVDVTVDGFEKGNLALGFTRGFTQSQAFVTHFGPNTPIPKDQGIVFDTSQKAGTNAHGEEFTYQQEYEWLGFTAREKIFDLLNEVLGKKSLVVDVFLTI